MTRYKSIRPKFSVTDKLITHLIIYSKMNRKTMPQTYLDLILLGLYFSDKMENGEREELLQKIKQIYL